MCGAVAGCGGDWDGRQNVTLRQRFARKKFKAKKNYKYPTP